ncbi:MAG: gamma-glutamyl-gamma-aminobutyrate hydrolase family protein [Lachnospiraceae bacterium]|nr:gamma-glutamyl-gamma-aminobutyrate hydrolase family protein [Lachnospiraceae bacterium]
MMEQKLISTKAGTLFALRSLVKKSSIEEMYILWNRDYQKDKLAVCHEIMAQFRGRRIVVRSSSSEEDSYRHSNAGHYKSILDVDSSSEEEIIAAVDAVIASYVRDIRHLENEQVLIQCQAQHVVYSGVVFTRDIQNNKPYYLINYDETGSTDSVTSGSAGRMMKIVRNAEVEQLRQPWRDLLYAVQELEHIMDGLALDIEFAIDRDGRVILFQMRPLVASYRQENAYDDHKFYNMLENAGKMYEQHKNVITGTPMMMSDMAFWNPSEIIGNNPRPLDYSLYRAIITHRAWNQGIEGLGYRRLQQDLMHRIGNKPYICLEYAFYSLIPQELSEELSLRLVAYYQDALRHNLTAHDKIEFEIVFTSYDFSTPEKTKRLLEHGFREEERQQLLCSLKHVTEQAILRFDEILAMDRESLRKLEEVRVNEEKLLEDPNASLHRILAAVQSLRASLQHYGTPQFARQARMAFMARAFLRSLTESGPAGQEGETWFTEEDIDAFMQSITTVSTEFEEDFRAFSMDEISRAEFNRKYGHLRVGTYDIRTERYDQMNFRPGQSRTARPETGRKRLDAARLEMALRETGLSVGVEELVYFIYQAIKQREYFKFEFTKSLSLILELLVRSGAIMEIARNDLSWLEIEDFKLPQYMTMEELKDRLELRIERRRLEYQEYQELFLPEVILDRSSLNVVEVYEARPNFITTKRVEGEVVLLDEEPGADIRDKIVIVPKADPGYEWVFAKGIKGFITRFGGAASHMAIRCAEFEIPAAIGCGEKIYNYVSSLSYLVMDCRAGKIEAGLQYRNLSALITQREGVNQYGDPVDILESGYVRFYELLGFIPKAISNFTKNVEMVFNKKRDLLIVVGGGSLPPEFYDRPHEDELQPHRDHMEEQVIHYCLAHGIPIIATCRGMQYINVMFGGKLWYYPKLPVRRIRGVDHEVWLVKEQRNIWVNNYHSDCIYEEGLAPCFEPLAIDRENHVVEAFGSDKMKVLALQWHPERRFETGSGYEETRKIILDFIQKYVR